MNRIKYAVLVMVGIFGLSSMGIAQHQPPPLLIGDYELGGVKQPENRYYYFETILTNFAQDGTRSPGLEFRLWLETQPAESGGVKYICRKFTLLMPGGEEVEIPSLSGWTYSLGEGIDEEGNVFGIDHQKFMLMMDSKARFINMEAGYMVYNAFIDFHALSDVLASGETAGTDINALKHIGDKIIHSAANSHAPVGLGEAMNKGSEFRNGEVTLEFKGVSVVDGVPCALLGYDSGDSSFIMHMEAIPGVEMIAEGASHYQGDVYVELESKWLRKATLYELVVSQVKSNGEATGNGIIERELLLETMTKEAFEQL